MKTFNLIAIIAVFLVICMNGTQAQTTQPKLNQSVLIKQFLGTYQANISKDTIETWETQQHGKAFIMKVSQIIKSQKKPYYINNMGFDSTENMFKGYLLFANGGYATWVGSFTAEKTFTGNLVQNFDPLKVRFKLQGVFGNKEFVWTEFDPAGVKVAEYTYKKIK